jgi:hypothetical protein
MLAGSMIRMGIGVMIMKKMINFDSRLDAAACRAGIPCPRIDAAVAAWAWYEGRTNRVEIPTGGLLLMASFGIVRPVGRPPSLADSFAGHGDRSCRRELIGSGRAGGGENKCPIRNASPISVCFC